METLVLLVLASFAAAPLAPLVERVLGRASGAVLALVPLAILARLGLYAPEVIGGAVPRASLPWVPQLGVRAAFRLHGFALLMALLVTIVGVFVLVYGRAYLDGKPRLGRFQAYLLVFMGSMLGIVLADDLFTLFVAWELTGIASFLLIGFHHHREEAREGAQQALLVTVLGGLSLMAGFLLLGEAGGSLLLSELVHRGAQVRASPLYLPILVLVVVGALTKSAQFPFHFWLPDAMEAPTPASSYLHSATMVKAGVYLLAVLTPVLGGTLAWTLLVGGAGLVTMLLGAYLALWQGDYKRVLAYSTLGALGTLVLLLGLGTPAALQGMVVILVAHALYKAALFMVAGAVEHATGTREIDELQGLGSEMPVTAAAALLAALSLAGFAPVLSFMGKELLFEAVLAAPTARPLVLVAAMLTAMLLVAVAGIVGLHPFVGERRSTPKEPHEPSLPLLLGPVVLAGAGLVFGLRPQLAEPLLQSATAALLAPGKPLKLTLWHGVTPALLTSAASILGGILIYRGWLRRHIHPSAPLDAVAKHLGPARLYDRALDGLKRLARLVARGFQDGLLRHYLLATVTVLLLVLLAALATPFPWSWRSLQGTAPYDVFIVAIIASGAVIAATNPRRLPAFMGLGAAGYGVATTYMVFGAPDLAMTQFLVETLTVVLFVLMARRLPGFARRSPPLKRVRDAGLALAVGGTVTTALLLQPQGPAPVSGFFLEHAAKLAHGRNVVNVILVDFRALDTLGEITVLAVAALGVAALLAMPEDLPVDEEVER